MSILSNVFAALLATATEQAAEEEQRVSQERIDKILADYDREQEEERQFYQHLDEQHERKAEEQQRNQYRNERELLEWELQNAVLYSYEKEAVQNRLDWLNEQEDNE